MGKSLRNATTTILRKSPRLNPSIPKDYANDQRKRVGDSKKQLEFDYADSIREIHPDSQPKKELLKKNKAKNIVVQPMRNIRSTKLKHQNSHLMLQLFGKLWQKYLPGENDTVLTYIIDDNVF